MEPPRGVSIGTSGDVTVEDESAPGTVEPPRGVSIGTSATSPSRTNPRRGRWNPRGGIDWDLDVGEGDASGSGSGAPAEIDWNIEAEIVVEDAGGGVDSGSRANVDDDATAATVVGLDCTAASSSARPFSAVLARQAFRAGVVDNLLELRAFLRQRASDLRGKEATTLLSSAPASIRANVSPDAMSSLADACEAPVCASFGEPRVARSSSARAHARRDRLAAQLEAKGALEGETVGRARGRGRATRGDAVATVAGGGAGGDDETRVEGRQIDGGGFRVQTVQGTRDERHRGD